MDSSPISSFSGFSESNLDSDSDVEDRLSDISSPSSVNTSDLSDFEDIESPSERDPDSDIDTDEDDTLSESDEELDSQLSELPLSQVSSTSDDDFWSEELEDVEISQFEERCGPVHMLPLNASALDFFSLFFTEDFLQHLVYQTNLYAQQCNGDNNDDYWEDVAVDEMRAFLGINILMGVMQLACYRLYWSTDPFLGNSGIRGTMTENRFAKLYQYLHVNDNSSAVPRGEEGYDKLYKVRPLIETVNDTFKSHYRPNKNQTIDEAMVKYKGRFSIKQYMPGKPIKRGMKVWMRCDSTTGYCHQFNIYMGKDDPNKGPELGQKVVKLLCKDLKWKAHHVYMDRYFTSIPLARCLEMNGIYSCGTIKSSSRGIPDDFSDPPRLARGESLARQNGNLVATLWQDKKQVHIISTNSNPSGEGSTFRRLRDGRRVEVSRPPSVENYHKYMGGVDRNNQLRAKTPVGRPAKKWWKYIFFYLLNLCITNAFLVMKETPAIQFRKKRYTLLDFRTDVAKELIGNFSKRERRCTQQRVGNHYSVHMNRPKRRCRWCAHQQRRRETVFGCLSCDIHLCKDGCFEAYHRNKSLPF